MGNTKVLIMVAAVLVIAALSAHPAIADISGPAMVTDGDSLKIDGQRIRIFMRPCERMRCWMPATWTGSGCGFG